MKIKNLPNLFYTLLIVLSFKGLIFSQTNINSSPVNWENYTVKSEKAAFLMPRMPVVVNESSYCRGEQTFAYGSYTDGAAYVVRITAKIDVPEYCTEKKPFNRSNFEARVKSLLSPPSSLTQREKQSSNEIVLVGNKRIHKLFNDSKNNRWYEFQVVGTVENKPAVKNFLASLKTGKTAVGIEIGEGAVKTLGDEPIKSEQVKPETVKVKPAESAVTDQNAEKKPADENGGRGFGDGRGQGSGDSSGITNLGISPVIPKSVVPSNNGPTEGVIVVLKPRANYTDMARNNQTQGKVVLRVTFSANGGIGSISVISGLADGLTEQAIAAARRILFIPASRGGVRYSVTKPVEYTFTIY